MRVVQTTVVTDQQHVTVELRPTRVLLRLTCTPPVGNSINQRTNDQSMATLERAGVVQSKDFFGG